MKLVINPNKIVCIMSKQEFVKFLAWIKYVITFLLGIIGDRLIH